jgi:hypothetical protein
MTLRSIALLLSKESFDSVAGSRADEEQLGFHTWSDAESTLQLQFTYVANRQCAAIPRPIERSPTPILAMFWERDQAEKGGKRTFQDQKGWLARRTKKGPHHGGPLSLQRTASFS